MFQIILALIFVGMILTPALVAARSGKKEMDAEVEAPAEDLPTVTARVAQRTDARNADLSSAAGTLPLHRTLGLSGR
ncbi:hypothetical protein [Silvibacterium dinghuense]|uniref:Uncharacterized protein n=1 Tax=Silvibacterium dinghuense TaxID=1560006 RepID=A0A4Q1SI36_9BACT|nr:hypothetical protein [Silvibacterium dinghuense]RXS97271.1 hypothetical protein ESZ00_04995 [Silvibacterium dinghuense]GGG97681.1 hypothetical protein GCM10011586_11180 [Silvibacterium dinghuense]